MKTKIFVFVVLTTALLLSACGGQATVTSAPAATNAPAATSAPAATNAPAAASAPAATAAATTSGATGTVTLTIESWRTDDLSAWQDTILPVFMKEHPNIKVVFSPTPNSSYDSVLATKIAAGTAGDLIMVEPFDWEVPMYQAGQLANLTDLDAMKNFSDAAKGAWQAPNGDYFAVPLESVIHGFFYNIDIFNELGLKVPTTMTEFYADLDAVKANGKYTALDMGTSDEFVTNVLGYELIGQGYWKGETGRLGLVDGTMKFSDPQFVAPFQQLQKWTNYMPAGYQSITYADMQNLFTTGQAAVYPAGSWDIPGFEKSIGTSFKWELSPRPWLMPIQLAICVTIWIVEWL